MIKLKTKINFKPVIFILWFLIICGLDSSGQMVLSEHKDFFKNPPMDCYPHTRWWWPGTVTTKDNIIRDYLHHEDLFQAVINCIEIKNINDFFDVGSAKEVSKFDIINYFIDNYSLKVRYSDSFSYKGSTGKKDKYIANNLKASNILNYKPKYSSLDCIEKEVKHLL